MNTDRFCCDGKCNDNQGRGGCPRLANVGDLSHCAPTREQEVHAWLVLILFVADIAIWSHVIGPLIR